MKKVAIVQSNYIPWKGYFDLIAAVDEFILYDDVQYTKRDWRNRNLIKTKQGLEWLTIPIGGSRDRKIYQVAITTDKWQNKHWKTLEQNYCHAPYFEEVAEWLKPLYKLETYTNLSQLNRIFIEAICKYIGITTLIRNSLDYKLIDGKTERLVNICIEAKATEYITGPSARNYINEAMFFDMNIKLSWFNYDCYPPYFQLWGDFKHNVTILDLIFNVGKNSRNYMKYVKA
jgi:hypothetical protein